MSLRDKASGAIVGAAVGDALGGATEGYSREQIIERHGGRVQGIVGPFHEDWRNARPIAPYYKGDGHITDDTLMTHALIKVYQQKQDHLDAFDIAERLVPLMINEREWIPELQQDALILQRVFLAEKWLVSRLHYGHVDPREAGVGNLVNCGATMYMAPVGVINAADPKGAYDEAIEIAGAHQSSYGREAAGVFAASVAAAMNPQATVEDVVDAALAVAKDGTREALKAVVPAARECHDTFAAIPVLREAVRPFDLVGDDYRKPGLDSRRPSRTASIEELPIAIGMVIAGGGDFKESVLGAVNYGRDADSIATMAGAICGALGGIDSIPSEWSAQVSAASKRDLVTPALELLEIAQLVWKSDQERAARVTSQREMWH